MSKRRAALASIVASANASSSGDSTNEPKKRSAEDLKTREDMRKRRRIQLEAQTRKSSTTASAEKFAVQRRQQASSSNASTEEINFDHLDNEFPEELLQMTDTELVLQRLREWTRDPLVKHIRPPIILRHMIYQMLADRTDVDRTIDELIKKNLVRQFRLNDRVDGVGYVFVEDLIVTLENLIRDYFEKKEQKKQEAETKLQQRKESLAKISPTLAEHEADEYKHRVLSPAAARLRKMRQQQMEATTTKELQKVQAQSSVIKNTAAAMSMSPTELLKFDIDEKKEKLTAEVIIQQLKENMIPNVRETFITSQQIGQCFGNTAIDAITNIMVHIGFLTIRDEHSFWFAVPGLGNFLRMINQGREEIVATIKRKKYKEIMLRDLERKKGRLKSSTLSIYFHIKDLLGSGVCESVHTTNGPMLVLKQ